MHLLLRGWMLSLHNTHQCAAQAAEGTLADSLTAATHANIWVSQASFSAATHAKVQISHKL